MPPSTTTTVPEPEPPVEPAEAAPEPPPESVEVWRELVAAWFPADEVDKALAVMACESGGDPNAYNPSGATGLMQVKGWWAPEFGYEPADLFDPAINMEVARAVWDIQGWGGWSCA